MKNFISIRKGPDFFNRFKTDENGNKLEETEKIDYSAEQFFVTDGKSCWIIDENLFKIEKITNEISGESFYKIYQGTNVLEITKEIEKINF